MYFNECIHVYIQIEGLTVWSAHRLGIKRNRIAMKRQSTINDTAFTELEDFNVYRNGRLNIHSF